MTLAALVVGAILWVPPATRPSLSHRARPPIMEEKISEVLAQLDQEIAEYGALRAEARKTTQERLAREKAAEQQTPGRVTAFGARLDDDVAGDAVLSKTALEEHQELFERGIKLMRMLRMTRIFDRFTYSSRADPSMVRLAKLLLLTLFQWHWVGCIYWFISSLQGFGTSRWTPNLDAPEKALFEQYGEAFFWAVSATTGQGRGIEPEFNVEYTFTIIVVIAGVILLTFIVGSATSVLANVDSFDQERHQKEEA